MENWHLYLAAPNASDKFKVGLALHPRDRWDALGLRDLDEEVSIVLAGKRSDVVRAEKGIDTARTHFLALLDCGERFSRVDFAMLTRFRQPDAVNELSRH